MNAGLPGTGLGGMFYIASAMLMPFHRAARGGGYGGRTWHRVLGQAGIAIGILLALIATGWLLALLIPTDPAGIGAGPAATAPTFTVAIGVLRWLALAGTLGLLALVLIAIEVTAVVLRRRRAPRALARARRARISAIRRRRRAGADATLRRVA